MGKLPSEERDAPESLKSSPPICTGKTRSWGRMCGILVTFCSWGASLDPGPLLAARLEPLDAIASRVRSATPVRALNKLGGSRWLLGRFTAMPYRVGRENETKSQLKTVLAQVMGRLEGTPAIL